MVSTAVVLCVYQKSQIQALQRIWLLLPMGLGDVERVGSVRLSV